LSFDSVIIHVIIVARVAIIVVRHATHFVVLCFGVLVKCCNSDGAGWPQLRFLGCFLAFWLWSSAENCSDNTSQPPFCLLV